MFSVTLKSIGIARTLEAFLTHHDFLISCTGHLENLGSENYADLQILTHFIISFFFKKMLISPIPEKSFKYWEAGKSTVADSFPKF